MGHAGQDESERMAQQLFGLIFSKVITQCLGAVAELGSAARLHADLERLARWSVV